MSQVECASAEMPRYKSHKTVWALKIAKIEQSPADELATVDGGTWRLIPEDKRYGPITVPHSYVEKHQPHAGGYFVVYADGYQSFSPAKAFEDGYIAWGDFGTGTKAETGIEAEIQAVGANVAPRITPDDVEANIASEHYFTAADGAYGATRNATVVDPNYGERSKAALGLLTFCVLVLKNGYTVHGASGVASPENFNAEIVRKVARENAVRKIWPLMGYELRSRLAANT